VLTKDKVTQCVYIYCAVIVSVIAGLLTDYIDDKTERILTYAACPISGVSLFDEQ